VHSLILQDCVIYKGGLDRNGYPENSRRIRKKIFGLIPQGLEVDHLCYNPSCINPNHLELVTGQENHRRRVLRKTHCSKGHAKTFRNVRIASDGTKKCLECYKLKQIAAIRIKSRRRTAIREIIDRLYAKRMARNACSA
jgi:hypothetical protein